MKEEYKWAWCFIFIIIIIGMCFLYEDSRQITESRVAINCFEQNKTYLEFIPKGDNNYIIRYCGDLEQVNNMIKLAVAESKGRYLSIDDFPIENLSNNTIYISHGVAK